MIGYILCITAEIVQYADTRTSICGRMLDFHCSCKTYVPLVMLSSVVGLESMKAMEAAVGSMDKMGGPPTRDPRRLQPAPQLKQPSEIRQFQRLKRKAPEALHESVEDVCESEGAEELRYNSLQGLCKEALKLNTSTEAGEQAFLSHACTLVEALGLCFDDCYDESSRLPGAPDFEQRVAIVMKVMFVPVVMLGHRVSVQPCHTRSACQSCYYYIAVFIAS